MQIEHTHTHTHKEKQFEWLLSISLTRLGIMGGGNWSILLCKTQHNKYFLEIYFENRMNRWYYQKWKEIYYFLGNFPTCYLADMKKNRIFLEHHSMTLLELLLFIGQTCKTFLHKTDEQRIHPQKNG